MNNENIKEQVAEGNGAQLDNENIPEYKKRFRAKDHTPEGEWVFFIDKEDRCVILGPIEEGKMRQWIGTVLGVKTREENAQRIVECVNAMAGIENPKEYMNTMREVHDTLATTREKLEVTMKEYKILALLIMRISNNTKDIEILNDINETLEELKG